MKILICGFVVSAFFFVLADVTNVKESGSEESGYSKRRREASLMSAAYHGPSYKYLPPTLISPLHERYPVSFENSAGYFGGHISDIRGGYSSRDRVQGYIQRGYPSTVNKVAAPVYNRGHHDYAVTSVAPAFKAPANSHFGGHGDFSANHPNSYAIGGVYGSPVSSVAGYKSQPHALVGTNVGLTSDYHFLKGTGASLSSPAFSGPGLHDEYHADHIHNGGQEHVYVILNTPASPGQLHHIAAAAQPGTDSYLPPTTKQYSSVGHEATIIEHGPAYAAGHKGLGYFSFTANKPQVLHTSVLGSNPKQSPFKPSTFLGAKFEDTASTLNEAANQHYLPPLAVGSDSTGYEYQVPKRSSFDFKESTYQQSGEAQPTSVYEPDASYLPPKNNDGSVSVLKSTASDSYLPPSNSYGVPYSH